MKSTPLLMSTELVGASLKGDKTQTRRLYGLEFINRAPDTWTYVWDPLCQQHRFYDAYYTENPPFIIKCPYGQVGDRIWLRETHYRWGYWARNGFSKTGKQKWTFKALNLEVCFPDFLPANVHDNRSREINGWFKRPSIFMPRWASRFTGKITGLRAERLREISLSDIEAEGIRTKHKHAIDFDSGMRMPESNYHQWQRVAFIELWDSLNANRKWGHSWAYNPWAWRISYQEVK